MSISGHVARSTRVSGKMASSMVAVNSLIVRVGPELANGRKVSAIRGYRAASKNFKVAQYDFDKLL